MWSYPSKTVKRSEWGEFTPSKSYEFGLEHPILYIILSHTETPQCTTQDECIAASKELYVKAFDRGMLDLRYNFLVGGDGYIYEGRGWINKPPKYSLYSYLPVSKTLEIGYFGPKGERPIKAQRGVAKELVRIGVRDGCILKNPIFFSDL